LQGIFEKLTLIESHGKRVRAGEPGDISRRSFDPDERRPFMCGEKWAKTCLPLSQPAA
jgi:hypothetical protein